MKRKFGIQSHQMTMAENLYANMAQNLGRQEIAEQLKAALDWNKKGNR